MSVGEDRGDAKGWESVDQMRWEGMVMAGMRLGNGADGEFLVEGIFGAAGIIWAM